LESNNTVRPLLLLLETSTDVCSVSLSCNGEIIQEQHALEANSHTEHLTLLIQSCLREAGFRPSNLDAIAISGGPGSYTSLRIGAATAKGLCYATGCPLISLSSLDILAAGIPEQLLLPGDFIIPMLDARRMEAYLAVYDHHVMKCSDEAPVILDNDSLMAWMKDGNRIHLCGNGAPKFMNAFPGKQYMLHHIHTSSVYMQSMALAAFETQQFEDVAYFTPHYFKAPNITVSSKKIF
jgi:tRNA threonylcarbamoyladenosine biosynthesis protein TsaB